MHSYPQVYPQHYDMPVDNAQLLSIYLNKYTVVITLELIVNILHNTPLYSTIKAL